jgi:small conductance mechanosensitive channel
MIIPDVLPDLDTSQIIINLGQILIVIILLGVLHYNLIKSLDEIGRRRGLDNRVINQIRLFDKYVLYIIATLSILGILGIDLTVIATSVGVAGIAVCFAARDIISNFLSGIFIIIDKVYVVDDVVNINGTYGIVEIITLRNTQIRTFDCNIVTVPNS